MSTGVVIREECAADREGIHAVNSRAFETDAEARLVERLREAGDVLASIVAVEGAQVVGHALFSPAAIEYASSLLAVGALGPVAVMPERQRGGIGSAVIGAGVARCWAHGVQAIIVLGHPDYYGRFGFVRADRWGIRCEFDAPPEAFMILWSGGAAPHGPGVAHYHSAFSEL